MRKTIQTAAKALASAALAATLVACGSGSGTGGGGTGVSPQVVSGVAATGAPIVGQVTLRDSSATRKDKIAVIANDGTFSIDVSDLRGPFLLKATGTAEGVSRTLFSFADTPGIANINPLSNAALASAAGVDDPAAVFDKPDAATLEKIKSNLPGSVNTLKFKLKVLLDDFNAAGADPVRDPYSADHTGLDGMFDNVKIVIDKGVLTVTNATTGAVIFTAKVSDVASGRFTENNDDLPKPGPRPAAPTGVSAAGGAGQVTISWDPVADATSYTLFYATKSGVAQGEDSEEADAKQVKNVTSPFVLKPLSTNTTYYFVVRALNNHRRGPPSAEVSATTNGTTPTVTIPSAPTGVSATGGTKQASITWAAVSGATTYNLYWSTTSGVTKSNGTKIAGVSSPAVHTGLSDGTTYYYVVTAQNSAGESATSVQVAASTLGTSATPTIPAAPTSPAAAGGDAKVTVSWTTVAGASSYNIYWSSTAGVTPSTGTRIAGVTSPYVHTGLSASTAYYYVVTALNSAGESGPSVQVNASTGAPAASAPAVPTGVAALGGTKQVSVSWTNVSGATAYNVYWSATSGVTTATGTKVSAAANPYLLTGLSDGTAYYFVVTATNASGESAPSAQVTASTSAPAIDGAALYTQYCSGCHGALGSSAYQGASAALITSGIANIGTMNSKFNATSGSLIKLTADQIAAIAAALK